MAKAKTTRKWVNENYYCVYFGYCELQYLLTYQTPRFYTCGVYGWNFDVYTFCCDYAITTGYRGMIENVTTRKDFVNHEYVHNLESKAEKIVKDRRLIDEQKKKAVNTLLAELLSNCYKKDFKVSEDGNIY